MDRKTVDPELREILLALARRHQIPCVKCGSLECGPVRCRFQDTEPPKEAA